MTKPLDVIIVSHSNVSLVQKCIDNLLDSWDNLHVTIVDNDSPDGTADLIDKLYNTNEKINLIRSKNNGLAAGNNLGLKQVTSDYILYMGMDAFPTRENLIALITFMDDNPTVGVSTGMLYTRDGKPDLDAHRGFSTPWSSLSHFMYLDKLFPKSKFFGGYNMLYMNLNTRHEIDVCISHFMLVRFTVQQKVGLWDEDYFLYGEDIDFCWRVKQAGYKVMYLGDQRILHYKGVAVSRSDTSDFTNSLNKDFDRVSYKDQTVTKDTANWMRARIARDSAEAMGLFYKKHLISRYPWILNQIVLFGIWTMGYFKVVKSFIRKAISS